MQTKESVRFMERRDRERNEERIGVLLAISAVSKRPAQRLAALEYEQARKKRGEKTYDTRQSAATWK